MHYSKILCIWAHSRLWEQFLGPSLRVMRTLLLRPILKVMRNCFSLLPRHFPGTGTLSWGPVVVVGLILFQDIPPKFLSTTCGCETSPLHICTHPTSLNGCGFFNSIVVRLPFNLISEGCEWWLFYILVVILMWLCKEVTHVCLCRHPDWESQVSLF